MIPGEKSCKKMAIINDVAYTDRNLWFTEYIYIHIYAYMYIYMNLSVCANIIINIDNTNANKADIL